MLDLDKSQNLCLHINLSRIFRTTKFRNPQKDRQGGGPDLHKFMAKIEEYL